MAPMKTAWMLHVEETMKKFPEESFKDVLKMAKKTYKKTESLVSGVAKKTAKMAKKALRMRGGADGDAVAAQPKPDEMPVDTAETAEDAAVPHETGAASSVPADASHTDSGAQTGEAAAAAPAPAAAADSKPADASSAPATPSTPAQAGGRKHRKSAKRHHGRKHHKTAKRHHRGRKH
jgi:hypothetical protein